MRMAHRSSPNAQNNLKKTEQVESERAVRLKTALKANLGKRKAQARARAAVDPPNNPPKQAGE